ncbi:heat shock protein 90-binding cochaperone Sba1 homeolog p [Epichloe bromicola]
MSTTQHPEICWAQRSHVSDPEKNLLYLTIVATDVPKESMKMEINPQSISFTGENPKTKINYKFQIELYEEIDTDHTKTLHTSRSVQLTLRKKKVAQEYWPRLTKDSKKNASIKTDFDKWVDEDSQEEASADLGEGFDDMG